MKQRWLIAAALVVIVFAAHLPALRAGFVWDDTALVLRDPLIRSWRLIPEGLEHFLFTDATVSNFYRPLQRWSYAAEYGAFGFSSHPYHVHNILLHALAALALFAFALALFELYGFAHGNAVAGIAAVAWALHPLHSAVVDYVSGRADSLAAIFGFSALYFAVCAIGGATRRRWILYGLMAMALLASALSKESGLIFSLICISLVLIRKVWRAITPTVIAITLVATIYTTLRSQVAPVSVPQLTPPAPALVRPIIAARALAEYAALLAFPINLHMDRDVESRPWGMSEASLRANSWRELETLAGVALFGALLAWLLYARKRDPIVFAFLVFAAITYAPFAGIFALNATIAEHWIYVPSAFALLAAAAQLSRFLRTTRAGYLALATATCWLMFLGVRSFMRAGDWRDERTFFERTISAGGDSARMLINLGALEMNEGHLPAADKLLRAALTKEPEQPFALLNLAAVRLKQRDFPAARDLLARAQNNPVSEARANEMIAIVQFKESGAVDLMRLRLASRTGQPSWAITQRYIRTLAESGRADAAVRELRAVLATEWYRAETWQLMSEYLTQLGHGKEAAAALAEAKRFDVHLNSR